MYALFILVLFFSSLASASEWKPIYRDYSGETVDCYIDKTSIYQQSDGHYRVWTKKENRFIKSMCELTCDDPNDLPITREGCRKDRERKCPGGKRSNYEKLFLYELSCTHQIRILSDEKIGEWSYIQPDSFGETLENEICKPQK